MRLRADRRAAPVGEARVKLRVARAVDLHGPEELELLRAVAHLGVERGAERGLWRLELRRELSASRKLLRSNLMRLMAAGVLTEHGPWPIRTVLLTDAGLATLAAAHEVFPSSSARAQQRRAT